MYDGRPAARGVGGGGGLLGEGRIVRGWRGDKNGGEVRWVEGGQERVEKVGKERET